MTLNVRRKIKHDLVSQEGVVENVKSGDLGNGETRYTYFNFAQDGFKHASVQHFIDKTTLTLEMTNVVVPKGRDISGTASATDGTGATLIDLTLSSVLGFDTDDDLIGITVEVTADSTTPANVGELRAVTGYTGATGLLTLDSVLPGATTSGVTQYKLSDSGQPFGRLVADPPTTCWSDVTNILTGSSFHILSGTWFFDLHMIGGRFRIKRVTTNAGNSCKLILNRGR